jgi:hypothetical protein
MMSLSLFSSIQWNRPLASRVEESRPSFRRPARDWPVSESWGYETARSFQPRQKLGWELLGSQSLGLVPVTGSRQNRGSSVPGVLSSHHRVQPEPRVATYVLTTPVDIPSRPGETGGGGRGADDDSVYVCGVSALVCFTRDFARELRRFFAFAGARLLLQTAGTVTKRSFRGTDFSAF